MFYLGFNRALFNHPQTARRLLVFSLFLLLLLTNHLSFS